MVAFSACKIYLCVCDEKSKLLTWEIRPVLSDQVKYKEFYLSIGLRLIFVECIVQRSISVNLTISLNGEGGGGGKQLCPMASLNKIMCFIYMKL